ncbi:cell division protein FtsK/SpoIIIE [Thermodesulfobium narugense DSM 14796]|uniref:Cell division protein FtsK/SpoIIIE n=1 Tax=Thermodesulfobium narugense DSM 14796 TaxID=747365 RepID=M1E4X0_9BACT|nr:DNA translocase FtsK [Thermodesulfobium narugense]AEE13811.1 cell division protein FtsK/SpoIIIE [Thermodesulfobium narugense DSM 14796]
MSKTIKFNVRYFQISVLFLYIIVIIFGLLPDSGQFGKYLKNLSGQFGIAFLLFLTLFLVDLKLSRSIKTFFSEISLSALISLCVVFLLGLYEIPFTLWPTNTTPIPKISYKFVPFLKFFFGLQGATTFLVLFLFFFILLKLYYYNKRWPTLKPSLPSFLKKNYQIDKKKDLNKEILETKMDTVPQTEIKNRSLRSLRTEKKYYDLSSQQEKNSKKVFEITKETYDLPDLSLFKPPVLTKSSLDHSKVKEKLIKVFFDFGIEIKVTSFYEGPTLLFYEISLPPGTKLQKVISLADEVALGLATSSVRIDGPIPGRGTLGIEIPKSKRTSVRLSEILTDKSVRDNPSKLLVALGKDVLGNSVVADIFELSHTLIAGATGAGKSVCVNSILMSLLARNTPRDLELLLIDPKRVELSLYEGIPHLRTPIIVNAKDAAKLLKVYALNEMEKRYDLFAKRGVRNLQTFNERFPEEKLPYIIIIIDEFADLMKLASQEVEEVVFRLAQMARATGIYLILATQRPSVDVITGTIKANIPSRIAFAVSSSVDSRTILDFGGAEKLLGRGDMLYYPQGVLKPIRVQGCLVDDEEIKALVDHWRRYPSIHKNPLEIEENHEEVDLELDDLFDEAKEIVISTRRASTTYLQTRLKIGFSRAARIMEQLEKKGIVSAPKGNSGTRDVIVDK